MKEMSKELADFLHYEKLNGKTFMRIRIHNELRAGV